VRIFYTIKYYKQEHCNKINKERFIINQKIDKISRKLKKLENEMTKNGNKKN